MPIIYGISPAGKQYPSNHKGTAGGLQPKPSPNSLITVDGMIITLRDAAKTLGCIIEDIWYAFGKDTEVEYEGHKLMKL